MRFYQRERPESKDPVFCFGCLRLPGWESAATAVWETYAKENQGSDTPPNSPKGWETRPITSQFRTRTEWLR